MALEWWQKNIIYHIYLPAFKDGNNDGIGDFKGLIRQLDYFKETKISSILLSPFYLSPMKDNGYDISSYTDIDPMFGDMDDFNILMLELRKRDMNIIIDFVANHTSDQHVWFQKSIQKEDPYTDFYIWVGQSKDSTDEEPLPPNNWLSVFDGSAWTWNEQRKQFYFHQFLPEQPDLNFRSPFVRKEMKKILQFWLDKGVDGFRIDAASHLFEDQKLLDEPVAENTKAKKNEYKYLNHIYTKGMKENLDLLEEWKQVLNEYAVQVGKSKILLVEAVEEIKDIMPYYGTIQRQLAEIPLNFQFYKVKPDSTGKELHTIISNWLRKMPKRKYPNWVMSSHDDPRVVTRVGSTLASSLHMVMMLLPGTPIWYYGDELGMENGVISPNDMKDSYALRTVPTNSRDPMRTPMQWSDEKNAGFTDADVPWLPVNTNYKQKNVKVERVDPFSFLNNFKKLISIRNQPSILFGTIAYPIVNEKIFSLIRPLVGTKCYLLILNMSSDPVQEDMTTVSEMIPQTATLELTNCKRYYDCGTQEVCETSQSTYRNIHSSACAASMSTSSPTRSEQTSLYRDPIPSTSHGDETIIHPNVITVPLHNIYLESHEAIIVSFIG